MNVQTVSFLKKNTGNLSSEEPLTITKNGKPVYVIESIQDWDKREEAIALLKLIHFAKNDMQAGRVISSSAFNERLALRKALLIENGN
jgi:PHD/YefM family antitoxin component YafN of YafNO toxin-antitoxin module